MNDADQHQTATPALVPEEQTEHAAASAEGAVGEVRADAPGPDGKAPGGRQEAPESRRAKARRHGGKLAALCVQLAFLAGVCYVGNAISECLPVPIPGNICSMALLLTLLVSGIINADKIAVASNFLLSYMPVFFIPAGVTILTCLPVIQGRIPQFVAVCAVTTVVVFLVTASTVVLVSRAQRALAAKRAGKTAARSVLPLRAREE